jgi:drug/metabolite transporter (DMT)-like permease
VPPGQWLLLNVPFVLLGVLMTVGSAAIAVAGLLAVRRRFSFKDLRHEVVASYMEMFGVVYAVLLAFVVFAVWETHEDVLHTVESEAVALDSLYHLAEAYPAPFRQNIQDQTTAYLHSIVDDEWPLLARGQLSPRAADQLGRIRSTHLALNNEPNWPSGTGVYSTAISTLTEAVEHRQLRRLESVNGIPSVLWLALLLGAAVLIGCSYLFEERNIRVQALLTGTLAAVIGSMLFIVIALDFPFSGSMAIDPGAFEHVLSETSLRQGT